MLQHVEYYYNRYYRNRPAVQGTVPLEAVQALTMDQPERFGIKMIDGTYLAMLVCAPNVDRQDQMQCYLNWATNVLPLIQTQSFDEAIILARLVRGQVVPIDNRHNHILTDTPKDCSSCNPLKPEMQP